MNGAADIAQRAREAWVLAIALSQLERPSRLDWQARLQISYPPE